MKITRRQFYRLSAAAAAITAAPPTLFGLARAEGTGVIRAHGGSLIGEPGYPVDFARFGYVNPNAPKGGTVRLATSGGFDSFNPFIVKGTPAIGAGFVFEQLMTASLDEGSTHYGLLAEWFEHPEDHSWVAFKLRDQARWWDGRPVTVEDVIWTLETLKQKGDPFYRLYYANVTGARDLGDGVVRFDFDQSGNRELPHIMGQLMVLPKHWWETRKFEESALEPMMGSGVYKVSGFEANRFVAYERVADYWGADLPVRVGQNNFDTLRWEYFRDGTAAFEAFKSGIIDYRAENSASNWAEKYEFPAVKRGDVVKQEIRLEGPKRVQTFAFNLRRRQFRDLRVRKAISLQFDFEWTNAKIYFDQYARPSSYFQGSADLTPQGAPEGAELALLEPFREELPEEVFTAAYTPVTSDGSGRNRRALRESTRLLKEAGWSVVDGKLVDVTGEQFRLRFLIAQSNTTQSRVLDPFLQNLKRLGIDAEIEERDDAQYIRRVFQDPAHDWDMVVHGVSNSESPGNEQREFWGSDAAKAVGSRNRTGMANAAVDSLVETIIFAQSREELAAATRALDRVLTHSHVMILQLYTPFERIAHWNKFGRPEPGPSRSVGFPNVWWWDEEKVSRIGAPG